MNMKPTTKILLGSCLEKLKELPDGSVQCCVTSPPYFGLRDYGTAKWEGGGAACDHKVDSQTAAMKQKRSTLGPKRDGLNSDNAYFQGVDEVYRDVCEKCGARRTDSQLGLEATSEAYVEKLVEVFREIWRVLRDDGTLWLNLGDSYNNFRAEMSPGQKVHGRTKLNGKPAPGSKRRGTKELKEKDLVGIPWMVAFALRADGWYLRQDIIWHKPAPMPESVLDRCTRSHEYIFMFTKSAGYFYDNEAVREKAAADGTRNKRSVWTVNTKPYAGAHFAVFPEALITPMILAGTSEKGCCPKCGAPWERLVETSGGRDWHSEPTCKCPVQDPIPCTVLDPFAGSGTTLAVAVKLGRNGVGCELNPEYVKLAEDRILRAHGGVPDPWGDDPDEIESPESFASMEDLFGL